MQMKSHSRRRPSAAPYRPTPEPDAWIQIAGFRVLSGAYWKWGPLFINRIRWGAFEYCYVALFGALVFLFKLRELPTDSSVEGEGP